jgi:nucleoside-diphosphate-sugar epimerase
MNILITGHKGYIGSNVFKALKKNNKIFTLKKNSISLEKKLITKIDCLIHCANKYYSKKSEQVYNSNYTYSEKLYNFFNLSHIVNKSFLFINLNTIYIKKISSVGVNKSYVSSKKKFSDYVKSGKKKIKFVNLLMPSVYGKEGNKKDFYYDLKKKLENNEDIFIREPNKIRYFISLSNFLKVIIRILKNKVKKNFSEIYVKHDFECTNFEFAKFLKKRFKSKSNIFIN